MQHTLANRTATATKARAALAPMLQETLAHRFPNLDIFERHVLGFRISEPVPKFQRRVIDGAWFDSYKYLLIADNQEYRYALVLANELIKGRWILNFETYISEVMDHETEHIAVARKVLDHHQCRYQTYYGLAFVNVGDKISINPLATWKFDREVNLSPKELHDIIGAPKRPSSGDLRALASLETKLLRK